MLQPTSTTVATVIPLPCAGRDFQLEWIFEEDYQRDRRDFRAGLDSEHLDRAPPLERQLELPRGSAGPGGKHAAPDIDLEHLERIAKLIHPHGGPPKRWRGNSDAFAEVTSEALAGWIPWVHEHRGRKCGPSPEDYAAQREWTRSRSASISYWSRKAAAAYRLPQSPPAIAELLGRSKIRHQIVGMIVTANNQGWLGVTGSAPEICALLDCSTGAFWDNIRWLREREVIVAIRRYAPNKEPGGAPVAIASNWYGPGPALLDRSAWWLEAEQTGFDAAWDFLRRERLKRRARLAGRDTALPFVDRQTWAAVTLDGAIEWGKVQAAWLEVEKAQGARVLRLLDSRTWEPPEIVEPPPTDPRAELFARVLEEVEDRTELGYLEDARRAGEAIAHWRATVGRGRDDDGYSAGAELENMVRRMEALQELEATVEEASPEQVEEVGAFVAEELASVEELVDVEELAEELVEDARTNEDLAEALDGLMAPCGPCFEDVSDGGPVDLPVGIRGGRDTIQKTDGPPVNRKIRRTGTSQDPPPTAEQAAAELRRALATLSKGASSRVARAIHAIRKVVDVEDHEHD